MGEKKIIDWVLTANGPGEISSHAKPLAREIRKVYPQARITLIILPCQFASGYELQMARQVKALDRIFTPREYRNIVLKKNSLEKINFSKNGVVIYLGGDPFHAVLLKNRFKYPAFAYAEKELRWSSKFEEVFTPKTVGNLMADAADSSINYGGRTIVDKELTLGLFPGSRPGYVKYMLPLMLEISKKLKAKVHNINFFWGIPLHLNDLVQEKFSKEIKLYPDIKSSKGIDLVITLLGTNTAIYAAQGIPMLVLFPFHRPDLIPLMGILGLIARIPLLGWLIKWLALKVASFSRGYVAIPNIISRSEVTPELKGYFHTDDVVKKAYELLKDVGWRNRISGQLRYSIGAGGAARKIVERIAQKIL